MNNLDQKIDQILSAVTDLRKDFEVHVKGTDQKMSDMGDDVQELRSDLWGKDGIKDRVHTHGHSISLLKWVGATMGGASIIALINSIFRLISK